MDGYFTASYEVAKAFPHPFDLMTPLGWDRDHIMAKAAALLDVGPDQGGPSKDVSIPDPSSLPPIASFGENVEGESQDPSSIQEDVGQASVQRSKVAGSPAATSSLEERQAKGV